MTERPLRIGIVGAGRRVANNFLPALRLLGDAVSVEWVHARRREPLEAAVAPWGVRPLSTLDADQLAAVDLVAISVPVAQNAGVVRQLLPHAHRLTVVIDTPVAYSLRQGLQLAHLLDRFARAVPAEDYVHFPPFETMRALVTAGAVGKVGAVVLDGAGYHYHGAALIRSFFGYRRIARAEYVRCGSEATASVFRFGPGESGAITYPYRRELGFTTVYGSEGVITTAPLRPEHLATPLPVTHMAARHENGRLTGFELRRGAGSEFIPLPGLARIDAMPPHDISDLNLMRTFGLARVLAACLPGATPIPYGVFDTIEDNLLSRIPGERSWASWLLDALAGAGKYRLARRLATTGPGARLLRLE